MAGTSDASAACAAALGRPLDAGEVEAARAFLTAAPAGCPAARVPLVDFAAHLGARLTAAGEATSALAGLRPGELYLAFAIARQDPAALAELDRRLGETALALRSAGLGEFSDEVSQQLRVALVLPREAQPPEILDYAGRGDLTGWLRTMALRAAWKHAERARRDTPGDEDALLALPAPGDDAETEVFLKARYAPEFKQALHDALARLAPRERTLLRQAFLDGLTVDKIGALQGVHRATAARWLAGARADLLEQTVKILQERLGVGRADLDSLWRLVRSRLDISQL